ncbi:HNH endonuclease [Erwinia sp. D4-22]
MKKRTINALLSRGLDSELAANLSAKGYTLKALKQMKAEKLSQIGLSEINIKQLHAEERPPIPESTLINLLWCNRRTCCVCRKPNKSIIVHHIKEWSISRDHSIENLAVLCLDCHDLAHTKKQLSQNLNSKELQNSKTRWETIVSKQDIQTLFNLKTQSKSARWDWINCRRVFELFEGLGFSISNISAYSNLIEQGFIDEKGFITDDLTWGLSGKVRRYFLDFGGSFHIAAYLGNILEIVMENTPVIDITPMINRRSEIKALVEMGSFISIQAPFYFSSINSGVPDVEEVKEAYYQGYNFRLKFTFQPWYCMSSSAKHGSMSGRHVQTVFGFVREISTYNDELVISLSCLGAGTGFKRHENRVKSDFDRY